MMQATLRGRWLGALSGKRLDRLLVALALVLALLPERLLLPWSSDLARLCTMPIAPVSHLGVYLRDRIRPPKAAFDPRAPEVLELESEVERFRRLYEAARLEGESGPRPKVYFEEWDTPMISAIRWVSELIGIAGGDDVFQELSIQSLGKDRIIADDQQVIARAPDIIIGSWCGKKFRSDRVAQRPGWDQIPAVANKMLFEIKSPLILQPGPAALTDGLDALVAIVRHWRQSNA